MKNKLITKMVNRLVEKYNLIVPIDFEFIELEGFSFSYEEIPAGIDAILFNKEIIINSEQPPVRQRFSIAHEIGHIFIPWHTGDYSCASLGEKVQETDGYLRIEEEANYFASKLLMPDSWLSSIISSESQNKYASNIVKIMSLANVSSDVAFRRVLRYLPEGYIGFLGKKNQMYHYINMSGEEEKEIFEGELRLYDDCYRRISFFENDNLLIAIWKYDAALQDQLLSLLRNCHSCAEFVNIRFLQDKMVCIHCLIPHMQRKLNSDEFLVIECDGEINRIFQSAKHNGYHFDLSSIKEMEKHHDLIGKISSGRSICAVFKYRESKKLEDYSERIPSRFVIREILEERNLDNIHTLQSINGIIGATKSEYNLRTAEEYYEYLQRRFSGRKELEKVTGHSKFSLFLTTKAYELSMSPRSKKWENK